MNKPMLNKIAFTQVLVLRSNGNVRAEVGISYRKSLM